LQPTLFASFNHIQTYNQTSNTLDVKSEQRNVEKGSMQNNKEQNRWANTSQETATDCGYVDVQANVSTVRLFTNKYIALNHEWNITGNYAARMHKTVKQ